RTIGFNFKWFFFIDDIYSYTKANFFSNSNDILNKHFNSDTTAYGYYISRNFKNSRLKLDIKPNTLRQINGDKEQNILSFDFNFHIENEEIKIFKESISDYKSYKSKALEIISDYGERK
ncbi:hypothetical protein ACFFGL_06780, partial [Mesonia maritima]